MDTISLGRRIAYLISLAGISQAELARRSSVDKGAVSRIVGDHVLPTTRQIQKFSEALGMSVAQFHSHFVPDTFVSAQAQD